MSSFRRWVGPSLPAVFVAGLGGAAIVRSGTGLLTATAGLGPSGRLPGLLAAALAISSGFLVARVLLAADGGSAATGSPGPAEPARLASRAGRMAALILAAIHGLFLIPLTERVASLLLSLASGEERWTPGLVAESLAALLVAGPALACLAVLWSGGERRGSSLRLAFMAMGGALALFLPPGLWRVGEGGHPVLPALLLGLAAGLIALERRGELVAGRHPERPRGPVSLSSESQAALALILLTGGWATGTLGWGLARLCVVVLGEAGGLEAHARVLLVGLAVGALAGSRAVSTRRGPWRSLAFYLALAGATGILGASLGDLMPAAYVEFLARWGISPGAEAGAALLVSSMALLGFAVTSGAAAGAASMMSGSGAFVATALLGAAAGALGAPWLILSLGLRSLLLTGASVLVVASGFTALLGEGRLAGRAIRAVTLMLVGAFLLLPGEGWNLRRFLAAPSQDPRSFLDARAGGLEGRAEGDRVLLYLDGPRRSGGLTLAHGENPAAFLDGRIRPVQGGAGQGAGGMVLHLPVLLSGDPGRVLVIGPVLPSLREALRSHHLEDVAIAATDTEVARLLYSCDVSLRPGARALSPPEGRLLEAGPRRVLAAGSGRWDLVVVAPPFGVEESAALAGRGGLRLLAGALATPGLASMVVPLDQLHQRGLARLLASFEEAFPGAVAWVLGSDLILVGGTEALEPDLMAMTGHAGEAEVRGALSQAGFDDPLRLLARGIPLAGLEGEGSAPGPLEGVLLESAAEARGREVLDENLEWLAAALEREAPPYRVPASFTEEAARAAALRLEQLRQVARLNGSARVALLREERATARALAEGALRGDRSDVVARRILAHLERERGDGLVLDGELEGARMAYREAMRHRPSSLGALTGLAWIRYGEGDRAGAEELLHRAASRAPWISQTWYRLGLIRYEAGDHPAAREFLGEAHWLNPARPEPLILLGDMARREGRTHQARSLYGKALETGARRVEIRAALASVGLDEGDMAGARREVDEALRMKPGDPEALMVSARVHVEEGEREAARRDLLAAVTTGGAPYRVRALLDPSLRGLLLDNGSGEPRTTSP